MRSMSMWGTALVCAVAGCAVEGGRTALEVDENAPGATIAARKITFDKCEPGTIPNGWKVEATNPEGPLADWAVVDAGNGRGRALAMTKSNDDYKRVFNICWTDKIQAGDVDLTVSFIASAGEVDQGGGPMWRVKDVDNYYVARANPLEDNFRIYIVKDGKRKKLASAKLKIPPHVWHTIRIVHRGHKIAGYLNGEKLLDVEDATFTESGGIGVWTKADAVTSFDDLTIGAPDDASGGGSG